MVKLETETVSVDEHGIIISEGKSKIELCADEADGPDSAELVVVGTRATATTHSLSG